MGELRSESGRQFDPLVVGALADLLAHPPADESASEHDELESLLVGG
jgi:hypothetical protein